MSHTDRFLFEQTFADEDEAYAWPGLSLSLSPVNGASHTLRPFVVCSPHIEGLRWSSIQYRVLNEGDPPFFLDGTCVGDTRTDWANE